MPLNFPSSPSVGQQYTYGEKTYTYRTGGYWQVTDWTNAPKGDDGSIIAVGTTPPVNPAIGDLWLDTN